jgi:hypothetical protein
MNILYYGMDKTSTMGSGLQIGPYFNLTLQQVSVGIITNLIVFPPSLVLVQLFKRSKKRHNRLSKIKKLLEVYNPTKLMVEHENVVKKSFELKFPWWFKIIAYILSLALTCVCLFFVIMKGVVLGDDTVKKWITSVLISFLSSVLLTQPLQVYCFFFIIFIPLSISVLTRSLYTWQKMALLTVFFVTLFRSFDEKNDLDNEGDENNVKLNEWNDEENGVESGLVGDFIYKNDYLLLLFVSLFVKTNYKENWKFFERCIGQKSH